MFEKNLYLSIMRVSKAGTQVIRIGEFKSSDAFKNAFRSLKKTLVMCDRNYELKINLTLVSNEYFVVIRD